MVPKSFYEDFADYGIPEIKRCPLTSTILHIKKLDPGEPKEMLAFALEPPNQRDIETAVLQLKEAFALIPNSNGIYDGDLTFIGRVMANLPLDIKLSKLIVFGYAFNCLEECIIIAASLSLQSFFARPFDKALEAYKEQLLWSKNTASDCLAYLYAYRTWKRMSDQGQFLRPGGVSEATWCRNSFIQLKRIKEADMLIKDIKSRLERLNIVIRKPGKSMTHEQEVLILKILIAGAFFPHYYLQEPLEETQILREINDNDPYSTVVLSNLPPNQGLLYACAVRDMLSCCSTHLNIEFEERKAYIRFERNHEVPSNTVLPAVYLAVKMRKLQKGPSKRAGFELSVFSPEEADRKMKQMEKLMNASSENSLHSHRYTVQLNPTSALKTVQLPSLDYECVPIFISHFNNCSHFWARYLSGQIGNSLRFLETTVNFNQGKNLKPLSKRAEVNMLCLAPYSENRNGPTLYYRAQVQDVKNNIVKVFFVDYGNMEKVDEKDLREIDENIPDLLNTPALAFECFLSEVKPSSLLDPSGNWCQEANMWFKNQINGARLHAKVYSIVQNTVRLELLKTTEENYIMNINQALIDMKYGEKAEESFVSKQNHDIRLEYLSYAANQPQVFDTASNTVQFSLEDATKFSDLKTTNRKVYLHGPSNPLEAKYIGLTSTDTCRCIQVEASSLNNISFNSEPQDPNTTMLVAAHVGVGAETGQLMLRNTTLMPKILGLPSLICLIFAPYAEIRTDKDRKTYTGALCGLGYDSNTGDALYPEHDIEIAFDTEFPLEDICQVNGVRMAFNMLLGTDGDLADYSSRSRAYMHEKLKSNLFQLLEQRRTPKTPQMFRCEGKWNMIPQEFLLNAEPEDSHRADYISILPLHTPSSLEENYEGMKTHLAELYKMVDKSTTNIFKLIRCQLCSKDLPNTRDLLLHLDSQLHQEKEKQFKQKAGYQ
ncbi:ATP-dependent RNA helicase TDRD9-like [Uloborus diversus]|uniref:ATP-dependent RNA helicase TDRD9-like n=1 Tax=Uloborus diversus TaxID=327109 RepID=UPI002409A76C|nr:ATP-dependent RNA helicase TDRD9-like [Uloborus diversus]